MSRVGEQRPLDPHRPRAALRPELRARQHAISSGHYLATQAGMRILDGGGNAIDAGVAAGICLGILLSDFVSFAGVAPILVYDAAGDRVESVAGVGHWPAAAALEEFRSRWGETMPEGIPRTVVPAAPDAWITALRRWGTRSFGEVAAAAIELAADGFPMFELMAMRIAGAEAELAGWPSSAAVFLPEGRPPLPGERFRQVEAARTLERMATAEAQASRNGRNAGLQAARDEFYKGETAERIARFMADQGGLLTYDDLASYSVQTAPPVSTEYRGWRVYACGPWSQGPALPEALNILSGFDLRALGQNSARYLHVLLEAIKLAFADREAYLGDPSFVDVPVEALLSPEYARSQRERIDPAHATPSLPVPGDAGPLGAVPHGRIPVYSSGAGGGSDTSYVCAVDRWGNVFSATPSDGMGTPVVPGVGMTVSPRGSQSWLDPAHPSVLAPGKRPRLTPNPAIAIRNGMALPFGTPGGDVQVQAMLQVFLNIVEFGMTPQEAVEAPRVASYSAPNSFWPHDEKPGLVRAESRLGGSTLRGLAKRDHRVEAWPEWTWLAGAVCAIHADRNAGPGALLTAAADPRRESYALGW
ncbi:MAG TPA: gamma-glutamyltransferase family protein [Steroidobacteraceae bacterium]|nr:gamma-glutamyltransferase family protein [Steroidobacteraceae bacterium]